MSAVFSIRTEISGAAEFPPDYFGPKNPHTKTREMCQLIKDILEQYHPYGVRGIGYQLINRYGYSKEGDTTFDKVERQVRIMRLSGEIPFDWIIDESRQIEAPRWWTSPQELLKAAADQYRAPLWKAQSHAVMVICEKHGLAGVLREA